MSLCEFNTSSNPLVRTVPYNHSEVVMSILQVFEEMLNLSLKSYESELEAIRLGPDNNRFVCCATLRKNISDTLAQVDELESEYNAMINNQNGCIAQANHRHSKYEQALVLRLRSDVVADIEIHAIRLNEEREIKRLAVNDVKSELLTQRRINVWRSNLNYILSKVDTLIKNP